MDVFLYDFNSPYAYLAAARVDGVMPRPVRWEPIAFAFILRAHDRRPWSFDEPTLTAGVAECEQRARDYGLPELAARLADRELRTGLAARRAGGRRPRSAARVQHGRL
jgi:2-hydroxychromene-2-carboxylate isomerase